MDPFALTVYESPFPKLRLGKEYDGGYVIADIPNVKYSLLISGGILDDISFEEHFLKKYTNAKCITFDGTINGLPHNNNPKIQFVKKNIGTQNTHTVTNLHDLIDSNNDIFLKMDIEGWEIPWIKSLSDAQLNKFSQITIEFHQPFSEKEVDVFERINKYYNLIHFHGNNCWGKDSSRKHKGCMIPNMFECTYLNKKYFTSTPLLSKKLIPSPIDMRNIKSNEEISIDYPPFVWSAGVTTKNDTRLYTLDDIQVYILNWHKVTDNVWILYNEVLKVMKNVTIINCDENRKFQSNVRSIQLDDSHFYASQFQHAIRDVKPGSIFCVIVGDNIPKNNFVDIFDSALYTFNSTKVGVYSPNDKRSCWKEPLQNIKGKLYDICNTDCGFWFIHPDIVSSMRNFNFSISKFGWGIDAIVIEQARRKGMLIVRDYSVETDQLNHNCNYDSKIADSGANTVIAEYNRVYPKNNITPPTEIPGHMRNDFTLNGQIPLYSLYFNETLSTRRNGEGWMKTYLWSNSYLSNHIWWFTPQNLSTTKCEWNLKGESIFHLNSCKHYSHMIKNKRVAVFNEKQDPWLESILVNTGASVVTSISFDNLPVCEHNIIKTISYDEFCKSSEKYDAIFSYESIQHYGLGRYGDSLNPNGDIQVMEQIYKSLNDDGLCFLRLPIGRDSLVWNAHRIYGPIRLNLMLVDKFKEIEWVGCDKNYIYTCPNSDNPKWDVRPLIVLGK
jgi:hypothetical protein